MPDPATSPQEFHSVEQFVRTYFPEPDLDFSELDVPLADGSSSPHPDEVAAVFRVRFEKELEDALTT